MATITTRLRYVVSSDPDKFQIFLQSLKYRVMIYQIVEVKGRWWLWYVPDDDRGSVPDNVDLDE